jgi:preprotein translocase subunit YajC
MLLNLVGGAALFAEDPPKAGGGEGSFFITIFPFVIIFVLFYFLLIRPQKREQGRRQEMLAGVKKNDRVVTVGGIYGVVTNVHREADEVTIKVDEATNTKLRITLSSIGRILGDEPSGEPAAK